MSNFNYMDDVPVKISESYKPLPKVFQIPQAITHRLQLPPKHYYESPHYVYDFQLEKKVLAKIPEWRRMRQIERDLRRERKQRREQQRIRTLEQQHKQMLGAVSYPDTEDLSDSSESISENNKVHAKESQLTRISVEPAVVATNGPRLAMTEAGSFHNILQPTILPQSTNAGAVAINNGNKVHSTGQHSRTKSSSSFNYKDFEEDTSSPFDNFELKTINDLDILAQVLQNTQIKQTKVNTDEKGLENLENTANNIEDEESKNSEAEDNNEHIENVESLQKAKAAIEQIDFGITTHIPEQILDTNETKYEPLTAVLSNNFGYAPQSGLNFVSQSNQQHQQASFIHFSQPQLEHYNLSYNQHPPSFATNHNYLYNTPTCNGIGGSYYNSPIHDVSGASNQYICHNANTYLTSQSFVGTKKNVNYNSPKLISSSIKAVQESDLSCKSKSVPDILKELTDELRNSEARRTRNYSYNKQHAEDDITLQAPMETSQETKNCCYSKLEVSTQKLARDISSMGFPLERVAKIAQIFGADDKKIIEHLIPLSELIDLGFDESRISEALVKFDNNKERALEYLIT